jgi:hypothetical protein
LPRRHARFDALPDAEAVTGAIELDRAPDNSAQHLALGLRPALRLIESYAVDTCELVAVDRTKGGD